MSNCVPAGSPPSLTTMATLSEGGPDVAGRRAAHALNLLPSLEVRPKALFELKITPPSSKMSFEGGDGLVFE